jgi:hypothetical protein
MPSTLNRATLFINDGSFGWSESYYRVGSETFQATMARAAILAQLRQNMLGGVASCSVTCTGPTVRWIRVSSRFPGQQRLGLFATYGGILLNDPAQQQQLPQLPGLKGGVLDAADNPYSAIEFILTLAAGGQSRRAISGVPDDFICDQGLSNVGGFVNALKLFVGELVANWGALTSRPPATPLPGQVILEITQDPSGRPIIKLTSPVPIVCSQKLQVFQYVAVPGTKNLNGTYLALPQTPSVPMTGSTDIWLLRRPMPPLSWLSMGNALVPTPVVSAFTYPVSTPRPTKRDRGRPFGLSRGRARVQYRA